MTPTDAIEQDPEKIILGFMRDCVLRTEKKEFGGKWIMVRHLLAIAGARLDQQERRLSVSVTVDQFQCIHRL